MSEKILACSELSAAAFSSYGSFVSAKSRTADADCGSFKFWNGLATTRMEGETSFCIVEAYGSGGLKENALEQHLNTTETLIPTKDIAIVVATSDTRDGRKPDLDSLKAFRVKAGDAVMFGRGVWHHAPLSLGETSITYVVFDKATPDKDLYVLELQKEYGFTLKVDITALHR